MEMRGTGRRVGIGFICKNIQAMNTSIQEDLLQEQRDYLTRDTNFYDPGTDAFYDILYPPHLVIDIDYVESELLPRFGGPVLELACGTGRIIR